MTSRKPAALKAALEALIQTPRLGTLEIISPSPDELAEAGLLSRGQIGEGDYERLQAVALSLVEMKLGRVNLRAARLDPIHALRHD